MRFRNALAVTTLLSSCGIADAGHPFGGMLGHHKGSHCCGSCCKDCELHLHLCEPSCQGAEAASTLPASSAQLTYAQVMPSTAAYAMPVSPMMSMPMSMPMMMPYPVQQASLQQPSAQASPPQRDAAACGCDERVERLEEGVKNLSQRMDRIELLLENQTIAMGAITLRLEALNKANQGDSDGK